MSTNLPRVTQRIFGENAMSFPNAIAQFGSVVAQQPNVTGDITEIQSLSYWLNGWVGATISDYRYPTGAETTGINKVITQQIAYILQKGIPEWDAGTTYFVDSFCQVDGVLYRSIADNNINNHPESSTGSWEVFDFAGANVDLSNLSAEGEARFANPDLSNLSTAGQAVLNKYLPLTGGTLTGNLNLNLGVPAISLRASSNLAQGSYYSVLDWLDSTVNPGDIGNISLGRLRVFDKNIKDIGAFQMVRNSAAKAYLANLYVVNNISSKSAGIQIIVSDDGIVQTVAPPVTNVGGIVTQVALSKAQNGYIKLGCGIIIQWGVYGPGYVGNNYTITFPIAFTSAPCVTANCRGTIGELGETNEYLGNVTTSNFIYRLVRAGGSGTDGGYINWIAVGY